MKCSSAMVRLSIRPMRELNTNPNGHAIKIMITRKVLEYMLLQEFIKTYCRSDELVDIRFKCDEETVSEYYGKANEIPEKLLSETMVQQVCVRKKEIIPWNGYGFVEFSLEILVQPVSDNPKTDGEPTQSEKLDSNENDATKAEKTKSTNPKNCTPNKDVMELNKDEFLKTEFGRDLRNTVDLLDRAIKMQSKCSNKGGWDEFKLHSQRIEELDNRCEVFKLAIKQFYGIEYDFHRTDDYYGFCTKDGSDWLYKVERGIDGNGEKS